MNYFITLRTYGTWLHGDERGSVDAEHNQFGTPLREANASVEAWRRESMKAEMLILNLEQRRQIEAAMREVATYRKWTLLSIEVRTNHIHLLIAVADGATPDKIAADMKTYGTRRLRDRNLVNPKRPIWAEGASKRYIFGTTAGDRIQQYIEEYQNIARPPKEPEA